MGVRYDPEVDVLYVELCDERVWDSDEVSEGVILHFGKSGDVVGLEVLDAKRQGLLDAIEVWAPKVRVKVGKAGGEGRCRLT